MGYQINNTCYSTRSQAENAYFSSVVPSIASDGKLYQVIFDGQKWKYEGQEIHAYLPECSPLSNMRDGSEIGWAVMLVMVVLWGFNLPFSAKA